MTSDPIRINVGTTGQANEDITQIVQVFEQEEMKWDWLIRHLTGFCVGKVSCYIQVAYSMRGLKSSIRADRGQCHHLCGQKRRRRHLVWQPAEIQFRL